MASVRYRYSIDDFPNHEMDTSRLMRDIGLSVISKRLSHIDAQEDICDLWFHGTLSNEDKSILDSLVATHSGEALPDPTKNSQGIPIVQVLLPEGRRCDFYTPNFCDKTTWYYASERVTNAPLVDSGNRTLFNLASPLVLVDVTHGKIFNEYELVGKYAPVVKVDNVTKNENSPGKDDGDFTIDYATGSVTFNSALEPAEVPTITYSKAGSSLHIVQPPTGKLLRIAYVEIQFSTDIGITDTLKFQMWGLADVFAPGQFPPGTKIPISGEEQYKTLMDFIADSETSFPVIPKPTGTGEAWRMPKTDLTVYRFDYLSRASTDLYSSYGMELRMWLDNDTPYEGWFAVGTFYGRREEENL